MGTTGKCPIIFTLKISAPGEGESSAVAPQKHATGFAGCSFAKPEPCASCSFSLGEKVRMRAVPEEFCLTPVTAERQHSLLTLTNNRTQHWLAVFHCDLCITTGPSSCACSSRPSSTAN